MDTITDSSHTAKVVFRTGAARGKVLALEERLSFGRDESNDVTISANIVSSRHAVVSRDEAGDYWLEDLGSKNGTFLAGKRITKARLKDQDTFCICREGPEMQFVLGVPKLPSILETSTATFRRTGSIGQAFKELIPRDEEAPDDALCPNVEGVREILDYRLQESSRRSRVLVALACVGFLFLSVVTVCVTVYVLRSTERGAPLVATPAPSSSAAPHSDVTLVARLEPLYGSLFLSYRERPIGTVTVTNKGAGTLSDLALSFAFDGDATSFLVEPYRVVLGDLEPGASRDVEVSPKLSNRMLSNFTREVTARLTVIVGRSEVLAEASQALFVYGRQIFNWDDPRRVAAFIDPDDPAVTRLVQKAWTHRPPSGSGEFPPGSFVGALTLLTSLAEQGLRYRPDAQNPISARTDWKANDRIANPSGTLLAKSGDCDDLSVLSCSLLEAGGIRTAFAVGSSHVFFLFDTGLPMSHLENSALEPRTVVPWKGRVWAPVEATELARPGATFAAAWAAAWSRREAILAGEFELIDVQDAWREYQPLSPPPSPRVEEDIRREVNVPAQLGSRLESELEALRRLFRDNLRKRVREIEQEEDEASATRHRVGLLYAQSGLFVEARRILEEVVFEGVAPSGTVKERLGHLASRGVGEEQAVVLLHLAITATLQGSETGVPGPDAVAFARAALEGFPEEAVDERGEALLRLALVHRLRGDLALERETLAQAVALRPALEESYRELVSSDGRVAGPQGKLRLYLRAGLR